MDDTDRTVMKELDDFKKEIHTWSEKYTRIINTLLLDKKTAADKLGKLEKEFKDIKRNIINTDRRNNDLAKKVKRLQLENERLREKLSQHDHVIQRLNR